MKWITLWRRHQFVSLELAAKIAYASLPRCDWTETIDWLCPSPSADAVLYMANAFTLNTQEKHGQPQLISLPLFYDYCGDIVPIRPSFSGRVYSVWRDDTYLYLDDWQNRYGDVFVKRRDLKRWIKQASLWLYLTEERRQL